jgi:glycosyltransferase involved in cell wall biosynthesis
VSDLVIGLWNSRTKDAARHLSQREARLILAPTVYWSQDMLPYLAYQAEALWYVSWDQASRAKDSWHLAKRVEVVRCAVDVEIFKPSGRRPTGDPWMLGRHSRDVPSKFSPDIPEYLRRIAETHKVTFHMLGAAHSIGRLEDEHAVVYAENAVAPAAFLGGCDVWVYAHAPYWRETACVSMLEAMASGLPVVVDGLGGMREYVQHGRTGFLCTSLDEFVINTVLLLDLPELYDEMRRQARAFVEEFHSLESLTQRLRRIIEA